MIWVALLLGMIHMVALADSHERKGIHVGAGVGISFPQGLQADAALRFSPLLSMRGGIGYLPSFRVYEGEMALEGVQGIESLLGYTPNATWQANASALTGRLLVDLHPFRNGFRITAGLYLGAPSLAAHAILINPQTKQPIVEDPSVKESINRDKMPKVTLQNQDKPEEYVVIQPSRDGSIDAKLSLGKSLQPYIGIGYGYAVPMSRVSFMLDLGVLYAGKIQLSSPNALEGDPNLILRMHSATIKARKYTSVLPLLNVGVSIRLF